MGKSELEKELLFQIKAYGLPKPVTERKFHPVRRFRFDFAWVDRKIAVEVEGGVWAGGRHVRGAGYKSDCEKYNLATLAGWRVYRFTSDMINDGSAIAMLQKIFGQSEGGKNGI